MREAQARVRVLMRLLRRLRVPRREALSSVSKGGEERKQMIETIILSTITAFGMFGSTRCEIIYLVNKSSWTEEGNECQKKWDDYWLRELGRCNDGICNAIYIPHPDCDRDGHRVEVWKREVGLCEDGTFRWRPRK